MPSNGRHNPIVRAWEDGKRPGKVVPCKLRGYDKVEFTVHALEQMKIRGLTEHEVLKVIREPEETDLPTQPNRRRFRRYRTERRAVDVVFEEAEDRIYVVTAMIRTLRGKDRR